MVRATIFLAPADFKTIAASKSVVPDVVTSSIRMIFFPRSASGFRAAKQPRIFSLRSARRLVSLCGFVSLVRTRSFVS